MLSTCAAASRRAARLRHLAGLAIIVSTALCAVPGGTVDDSFSRLVYHVTDSGTTVAMIHQAVLPDGRLLLMGKELVDLGRPFTAVVSPSPFWMQPPPFVTITRQQVPYDVPLADGWLSGGWKIGDTQICTGGAFTDGGTLFAAGGSRVLLQMAGSQVLHEFAAGLTYSTEYAPNTATWTRVPGNFQGIGEGGYNTRWYPTTLRLGAPTGDKKMLIIGGSSLVDFTAFANQLADKPTYFRNSTVELYDNGVYRLVSPLDRTPREIWSEDYTHAYQLPVGDILMFGQLSRPVRLRVNGSWQVSPTVRPGAAPGDVPNDGASTALLPLRANDGDWGYSNGSVLTVGGEPGTDHERSADVYDPATDAYQRVDLWIRRHYAALVTLPDSRIAIVAGHNSAGNLGVSHVQYYDPATRTVSAGTASMPEVRGYHMVASLLPDGRIVVGGGVAGGKTAENGLEQPTFRYYSPNYMTKVRPLILLSSVARVGQPIRVMWSHSSPVTDAVLIALSSETHSIDMNQRSVQIRLTYTEVLSPTSGTSTFQLPASLQTLPPGYYMLFVLDANRVPSIARIIQVTS